MRLLILFTHGLWLAWMLAGIVVAILGFWKAKLWAMPVFRTAHLVGLLITATVPLWNAGVCPLTEWEAGDSMGFGSFLGRLCEAILYWDAPPLVLSLLSASAAFFTIVVYFWHPPWRPVQVQHSARKVGRIHTRRQ